jgi:predicted molibdopterin-dependent oxidoreductase YjgC
MPTMTAIPARNTRLTYPMVRTANGLQRASWDEALDRAGELIQKSVRTHGPSTFGIFSCSKATNEMNYMAMKFIRTAVGSNNIDSCNRT